MGVPAPASTECHRRHRCLDVVLVVQMLVLSRCHRTCGARRRFQLLSIVRQHLLRCLVHQQSRHPCARRTPPPPPHPPSVPCNRRSGINRTLSVCILYPCFAMYSSVPEASKRVPFPNSFADRTVAGYQTSRVVEPFNNLWFTSTFSNARRTCSTYTAWSGTLATMDFHSGNRVNTWDTDLYSDS